MAVFTKSVPSRYSYWVHIFLTLYALTIWLQTVEGVFKCPSSCQLIS